MAASELVPAAWMITPAAEEEKRLEGAVREEMEDGRAPVAHGQRARHVAELADRGVGEDAFDVVLREGGERRADHGDRGHHGEHGERRGRGGEHGEETGHEVDTGGDHRRRVDQRGDGGGAYHGIRQPGVQRELGRLARDTGDQQQRDHGGVVEPVVRDGLEDAGDPERAGVDGEREQTEQEGDITEFGDQERLQGGGACLGCLPVVADEEV